MESLRHKGTLPHWGSCLQAKLQTSSLRISCRVPARNGQGIVCMQHWPESFWRACFHPSGSIIGTSLTLLLACSMWLASCGWATVCAFDCLSLRLRAAFFKGGSWLGVERPATNQSVRLLVTSCWPALGQIQFEILSAFISLSLSLSLSLPFFASQKAWHVYLGASKFVRGRCRVVLLIFFRHQFCIDQDHV